MKGSGAVWQERKRPHLSVIESNGFQLDHARGGKAGQLKASG